MEVAKEDDAPGEVAPGEEALTGGGDAGASGGGGGGGDWAATMATIYSEGLGRGAHLAGGARRCDGARRRRTSWRRRKRDASACMRRVQASCVGRTWASALAAV